MTLPPKPKAPLSSYFRFIRDNREQVKADHPGLSITELTKKMSEMYKQLSQDQLAKYQQEFQKEQVDYKKKMKEYTDKYGDQLKKEKKDKDAKNNDRKMKQKMQKEIDDLKIPQRPKRPLTSYFLYRQEVEPQVKQDHPNKSYMELMQVISQQYGQLTDDQKKKYENEFEKSMTSFKKEMDKFNKDNAALLKKEKEIKKRYSKEQKQQSKQVQNGKGDKKVSNKKVKKAKNKTS